MPSSPSPAAAGEAGVRALRSHNTHMLGRCWGGPHLTSPIAMGEGQTAAAAGEGQTAAAVGRGHSHALMRAGLHLGRGLPAVHATVTLAA
jgi:hypothetical protein